MCVLIVIVFVLLFFYNTHFETTTPLILDGMDFGTLLKKKSITIRIMLVRNKSKFRKDKWNSSGANEAVSKFSASIPDSTKDYISQTTGQMFSRERLRTISVCFGIGEERPFYIEKNPSLLIARIKQNVQFFYLNYLFMAAIFFVLTLFVTPSAIIGIALLGAAWAYVIKTTQAGTLKIGCK